MPEVARYVNPDARVLWAGTGPVVVNHAQALLPGPLVAAVRGDVCRPEEILAAPRVRARLGFSQWRGRADRRSELIAIGQ